MVKKILTIIFLTAVIILTGYVLVKAYPDFQASDILKGDAKKPVKITLEFWGLWDNSDAWKEIISRYENQEYDFDGRKVNVTINYTKQDAAKYQNELQRMKQSGNEPNIFTINNNWLQNYIPWLSPLEGNKAYVGEYGLIGYDQVQEIFPNETIRTLIHEGQLYGFPMYSDSLALYYNKDMFKKAGIENPPATWTEFKDDSRKITLLKSIEEIIQSGAAIGGGKNVNRSSDIAALLMMQGGAKVIDSDGNIDINQDILVNTTNGMEKRDPGKKAIVFYTEFSDPAKEVYSWNAAGQEDSVKAFAEKKTAMMFNYSYQMKNLLALSPDLNYGISGMPQLENSAVINFSNVWTPVVSKNNNCKVEPAEAADDVDCAKIAWSFLSFANQKENIKFYLDESGKAAARKDLIAEQANSGSKLGVFASQAETAVTYNKFNDKIDEILSAMIDEIIANRSGWEEIANRAVEQIKNLKK